MFLTFFIIFGLLLYFENTRSGGYKWWTARILLAPKRMKSRLGGWTISIIETKKNIPKLFLVLV